MWFKKKKKQQQPCHCFIFQCSVSCGRGHKQRNVYCMAKDGSHLEGDYCKHLPKPNGHRKCRGGRCPKWKAGAWSQVSNASPLPTASLPSATWPTPVCWLVFPARFWCFRGELEQGGKDLYDRILTRCGTLTTWLQPLVLWIIPMTVVKVKS